MSIGYVRNYLSPQFQTHSTAPWRTEQAVEFNTLIGVLPMMYLQPVIQYFANDGGGSQRSLVFGFRTKIEF